MGGRSIHGSMSSAPVCVQCPLASSLGEFPGYGDWLWYPLLLPMLVSITFPFAFHISVFTVAVSASHHQPSFFTRAGDPEAEFRGGRCREECTTENTWCCIVKVFT